MLNIAISKTALKTLDCPVFIWNHRSSTSKFNSYFEDWVPAAPFFVYYLCPRGALFFLMSASTPSLKWGLIRNKRAQIQFSGKALVWLLRSILRVDSDPMLLRNKFHFVVELSPSQEHRTNIAWPSLSLVVRMYAFRSMSIGYFLCTFCFSILREAQARLWKC